MSYREETMAKHILNLLIILLSVGLVFSLKCPHCNSTETNGCNATEKENCRQCSDIQGMKAMCLYGTVSAGIYGNMTYRGCGAENICQSMSSPLVTVLRCEEYMTDVCNKSIKYYSNFFISLSVVLLMKILVK